MANVNTLNKEGGVAGSINYGKLSACMHRLNESFEFSNSSQPRQVVGILRNPFSQSDASLTTRMKPIKVNEISNVMGFADVNTHIQVKKNAHPYLGDGCAMDGKQIPSPTFADMEANSTSFGELKTISEMNPSSKLGRDDDKEARSPIMPMKKSFVNMVADTKSVPKVNFRTLNNDEKVDDSDFVLPMDVITRAQNKFANLIVGYLARKTIAFILVKNYVVGRPIMLDTFTSEMCTDPWGRLGFARALIKVGADKELKQEVTMCPKRVIQEQQVNKQEKEVEEDGFTSVSHRRKK
ncbi:hypothetical protein Tco_0059697, partial [Tanacetum coccineum]